MGKKKVAKQRVTTKKATRRAGVKLADLRLDDVQHASTANAKSILQCTHTSAGALVKAYNLVKQQRGARRGMTTDEEQDLLRAMLVMSAAGVDGMAKQLIRDTVPTLTLHDKAVREGVEKFVRHQFRGDPDAPDLASGAKFLGRILAAPESQRQVIEEYIRHLTGGSLQSAGELMRIAAAFGLTGQDIGVEPQQNVKDIFDVRNKIIHELDVDLSGKRRKRNIRRQNDMVAWSDMLLEIAGQLLRRVDNKLRQAT